jgi:hypothetical protein
VKKTSLPIRVSTVLSSVSEPIKPQTFNIAMAGPSFAYDSLQVFEQGAFSHVACATKESLRIGVSAVVLGSTLGYTLFPILTLICFFSTSQSRRSLMFWCNVFILLCGLVMAVVYTILVVSFSLFLSLPVRLHALTSIFR